MVFKAGVSGNPSGRPEGASSKIPSQKRIEESLISGGTDAISQLVSLLKDPDEKVKLKACAKIIDEAMKLYKEGTVYASTDVRYKILENLEAAVLEIKTLSTTAEESSVRFAASAKVLDKVLDILKERAKEIKANKPLGGPTPEKEECRVIKIGRNT